MSFIKDDNFRIKMRPYMIDIYHKEWPSCIIKDFRLEDGCGAHPLDKEWGVDSEIRLSNGAPLLLQEKIRRYSLWKKYDDITFEYMNAPKIKGEWFHLAAHVYVIGYANEEETDIEKYDIINVLNFKLFVELEKQSMDQRCTGFENFAKWRQNNNHGNASFFAFKRDVIPNNCFICKNKQNVKI